MEDELSKRVENLDLYPKTFDYWIKRAEGNTPQAIAWRNYVLLMVTFGEAFSRAPMTEKACDTLEVLEHVGFELDQLLATLYLLIGEERVRNALP